MCGQDHVIRCLASPGFACTICGISGHRAIAAGMPLSVVGDRLGQTNRATTADTYGHLVPAADRKVADVMGRLLG